MINFYNDDIILTKEMAKDLLTSLTEPDEEYLGIRDRYVGEINEKYSFRQEGEYLIVDIPDLDLSDIEKHIVTDEFSPLGCNNDIYSSINVKYDYITTNNLALKYNKCAVEIDSKYDSRKNYTSYNLDKIGKQYDMAA